MMNGLKKTLSNVQEVLARDACVIILTDNEGRNHINHQSIHNSKVEVLILPPNHINSQPFSLYSSCSAFSLLYRPSSGY